MSSHLQEAKTNTKLDEKDIDELMGDLAPLISKMKSDVAFLRTSAEAMYHSLHQIKLVAWNNGSIRYDMVMEIMKRNDLPALSQAPDQQD